MAKKSNALIDLTDEELIEALRTKAEQVIHSYNSINDEIKLRSQDKSTRAMIRLTWAIVGLGTLQIIVALIGIFKK